MPDCLPLLLCLSDTFLESQAVSFTEEVWVTGLHGLHRDIWKLTRQKESICALEKESTISEHPGILEFPADSTDFFVESI